MKQKLSKKAADAKKKRDLEAAKSPKRKARKAENQVHRRKLKKGFSLRNRDVHHDAKGRLVIVSVSKNRGNFGKGTKKEN